MVKRDCFSVLIGADPDELPFFLKILTNIVLANLDHGNDSYVILHYVLV